MKRKNKFLKDLYSHGYMTVQNGSMIDIYNDTKEQTHMATVYGSTHYKAFVEDIFLFKMISDYQSDLVKEVKELIGISNFVKRQTKESRFSYYEGTWEELKALTTKCYKAGKVEPGYRDGVVLVTVPNEGFYTSICKTDESSIFETVMEKRQENESAFAVTTVVNGKKSPSKLTKIVLYSHETLKEDNDTSCNSDWEIISINCEISEEGSPMRPVTMMRNQRHYEGGTAAEYTVEEYMTAIEFWSTHALFKGSE